MKKLLGMAIAALALLPAAALADGFVGVNYTQLKQDDRFFGDKDFDTGEIFARVGGRINQYVSTELRVGKTLVDKSEGGRSYQFNYNVGGYVSFGYQLDYVRPYVLVGYTTGEEEVEQSSGTSKNTIEDISYGGGVDIFLGEQFGLNLEYTQYYDFWGTTYKGPSAGLFYRF